VGLTDIVLGLAVFFTVTVDNKVLLIVTVVVVDAARRQLQAPEIAAGARIGARPQIEADDDDFLARLSFQCVLSFDDGQDVAYNLHRVSRQSVVTVRLPRLVSWLDVWGNTHVE